MSSNVTGTTDTQDLSNLVNNLITTVTNIQTSFNNVQTSISNLNLYDLSNNAVITNINAQDGVQTQAIAALTVDDGTTQSRISVLEGYFPITNASILDATISQSKILNLVSNLATINSNLTSLQTQITNLSNLESSDVSTLTNNLSNQVSKEANDLLNLQGQINTLLTSTTGTTTNPYQPQLDTIKTAQLSDESNISDNTTSINTLNTNYTSLNTQVTNNLTSLNQTIASLNNLTTQFNSLNTSSTNNNSTVSNSITNLQSQITANLNTEIADVTTLTSNYNNLNTSVTTQFQTLTSNLNDQISKESGDISTTNTNLNNYITTNNNRLTIDETNIQSNTDDITAIKSYNSTNTANLVTINNNITNNSNDIITLFSDISNNNASITQNTNDIITINGKLVVDEANISTLQSNVTNILNYDISNNANITQINSNVSNNSDAINLINNTTIPNLSNVYLPINNPSVMGILTVNNIDNSGNTLSIGQNSSLINIGSGSHTDSKVINIGGVNDTINILGVTNSINTTNTNVQDKVLTLNSGGGTGTSAGTGLNFQDNDVNAGYFITDASSNSFLIKAPNNLNVFKITSSPSNFYDLATKLYTDSQDSSLQASITGLLAQTTEINNEITNMSNNMLTKPTGGTANVYLNGLGQFTTPSLSESLPYVNINAFPSTSANILFGDGSYGKLTNNNVVDGSLSTSKLNLPFTANCYMDASGNFTNPITVNYRSLNTAIGNVMNAVLPAYYTMSQINNQFSDLQTTEINPIYTRLDNDEANITTIQGQITNLQSNQTADENNISTMQGRITSILSSQTADETNITNLQNAGYQTSTQVNNIVSSSLVNYLPKSNPSITGTLNCNSIDTSSDMGIGANANSITIGTGINGCVINIGGPNDVINIKGQTNSIQTTNSQISNKTLTLNENEVGNNQSGSCGILIRDNSTENQGYILTDNTSTQFLLKPPQNSNIFTVTSTPTNNYDLATVLFTNNLLNNALTSYSNTTQVNSLISTATSGLQNATQVNSLISTATSGLQNSTQVNTAISNAVTNYQTSTQVNNLINTSLNSTNINSKISDNSLNPLKLTIPNDNTKFLCGDGSFSVPPTGSAFNNQLTGALVCNGNKITGCANASILSDVPNWDQVQKAIAASYALSLSAIPNMSNLIKPYIGSLSGISANLLVLSVDNGFTAGNVTTAMTNINNLITSLGGDNTKITVMISNFTADTGSLPSYATLSSSNYDAVLYYTCNTTNTYAPGLLNSFFNDGKGLVLAQRALCTDGGNLNLNFNTATYPSTMVSLFSSMNQSSYNKGNPVLNGVSSFIPYYYVNPLSASNGSTAYGNVNGASALTIYNKYNYRMIYLNLYPTQVFINDTSTNGGLRLILQSLLYAASKIN